MPESLSKGEWCIWIPLSDTVIYAWRDLKRLSNLIKSYPEDLEESLGEEFVQFTELLKTDLASHIGTKQDIVGLQFYCLIIDNSLESCFPNVDISLHTYLSLVVTNCSGECSFSKLKRIKNELRSTMGQNRLHNLTLMTIEQELLCEIDISSIINKFAHAKSRNCTFIIVVFLPLMLETDTYI